MIRPSALLYLSMVCLTVLVGCNQITSQQPFYFFEDGDLSHYLDKATAIDVPDVNVPSLDDVTHAGPPLSLSNADHVQIWNLTLEQAMQIGLENSRVMKQLTGGPGFYTSSGGVQTMYDPSIVETDPRYGVEAAISAFDAQFESILGWEKVDRPSNVSGAYQSFLTKYNNQDLANFSAGISKYNQTGGWSKISTNIGYDYTSLQYSPTRQWATDWNVDVTAEFRQPLFQGNGVQFNRIAGVGAIPGFYNGVILARIREDLALTEFEESVKTFVKDLETAYWELYLAYRELDSVAAGYHSALETWKQTYAKAIAGVRGGEAEREAQAREQVFLFRAQVEQRRTNLYTLEAQLRFMMGLAPADGRLIRPGEEPTTAKIEFDWYESQTEALVRNVELRRQGWYVKDAEMKEIAAKNFLLPRVDAVGLYRWYGMGNKFWDSSTQGMTGGLNNQAMESLMDGHNQEWEFRLQAEIPIGFRKEHAGVRNAQLQVAKNKTLLRELELDVSHKLADAMRQTDLQFQLINTNFNRRNAAKRSVEAVQAAYDAGELTINVLLDYQRRLAEAEVEFYRAIVYYNLAILDVHFRKGSLLEYNSIYLAEGPWPGKAYFDARQRARERDASLYLDYGFTRPKVFSRGPYNQHPTVLPMDENGVPILNQGTPHKAPQENVPRGTNSEELPTPAPEPDLNAGAGYQGMNRVVNNAHGWNLFSKNRPARDTVTVPTRLAQVPSGSESRLIEQRVTPSDIKPMSKVQLVNYEEPSEPSTNQGWKSVNASRVSDENQANRTPASTPASTTGGWKGI